MCCVRRWDRCKRPRPATRYAPRSIASTNTQSGSKALYYFPGSSPCSSPPGRNFLSPRFALRFHLLFIGGAPQVPARNRAVRTPALAVLKNDLRFRCVLVAVDDLEAFAYPQVVCGQDVGPAEPEHQEHLHGPLTDPVHLNEPLVDFYL